MDDVVKQIDIWEPKWLTREVLIGVHHIQGLPAHAKIKVVFTKWKGGPLYMDAAKVRSYPLASNGSIGVYAVPMIDFEREDLMKQEKLL